MEGELVETGRRNYTGGAQSISGDTNDQSLRMLASTPSDKPAIVTDSPVTRETLLFRLRNGQDQTAWAEFVSGYGPMLYRFVRSRGLQDADASDIVQDILRRVGGAIGRFDYEKEKGGFRAWLFTITRNRLYTFFDKKKRHEPTANDTMQFELLNQSPDARNDLNEAWEREHMKSLADRAMAIVEKEFESKTWEAFRMTTVDDLTVNEVSHRLEMSNGAIYVAKSRVMARLRTVIEQFQEEET